MAPVPQELSAPGTATYSSDTMTVGDGTWDFTKNTFLLPNLVGPNYDTMRYNGMGNRFSTVSRYHQIVLAHGILAALAFLILVPAGVFYARFYTKRPDRIIKHHAHCQLVAGVLLLAVFILGTFAVGPSRALTNPHHGIGVAVFVLFILQLVGGRFIKHITKSRSLRIKIHQWFGRTTAILGIIQIPLGLTLYGSPLALFIVFAVWMAILVLAYFILDHRRESHMDRTVIRDHHHRSLRDSRASRVTDSAFITDVTEKSEVPQRRQEEKSVPKWLLPLGIGAGLWTIMKGRKKNHGQESGTSYTRSSRSRSRHRPEGPSRRGSMYESEYTQRTEQTDRTGRTYRTDTTSDWTDHTSAPRGEEKKSSGGGIGKLMLGVGAALGGGKLFSSWMDRREDKKRDQAYSEVSTATPVTPRRSRPPRTIDTISEVTTTESSALSPVGDRTAYTASAPPRRDASRPRNASRPRTPQRSHARPDRPESRDSWEESAFTESPSRRVEKEREREASNKKGIMAMLGMGWLAKKMAAKPKEPDHRRADSRYDDGYSDYDDYRSAARTQLTEPSTEASTVPPMSPPSRRRARRYSTSQATQSALTATPANRAYRPPPVSGPPPPLHRTLDSVSGMTDSTVEQNTRSMYSGPPMPPLNPNQMPPPNQGQMPPYGQGQPPYNQGQPPYNQGQSPYSQGQPPYIPEQPPYNQGQPPYIPEQPTYNQGQPPYNQGQPPYNQGQPPYNPGQPTYNPGQPPYSQGQPPYNPGQPAYNPEQAPPPPLQTNFGYSNSQRSDSRTRQDPEHISMPHIPPDPHGFLYDDESVPTSPSRTTAADRRRTRRRRTGTGGAPAATPAAMPAAAPTPSALAADEEDPRRESIERPVTASTATKPSFPVRFNDEHDRNVTIRRMTDEEMSRNRSSSMSSSDDTETPSARRGYRRDTRVRSTDDASKVTGDPSLVTPTQSTVQGTAPPPAIAPLRRNQTAPQNKDSAYYSGPGQAAGAPPVSGLHPAGGTTVSSLVTAESHQESSAMGSAADRRSRRRQERRRADDSSASRDQNDVFN